MSVPDDPATQPAGQNVTGILIAIPRDTPLYRLNAMLLVAMAFPPKSADTPAYNRRVIQLCKCHWAEIEERDPSWRAGQEHIPRAELTTDLQAARRTRGEVLQKFNRALGGVEPLEAFFRGALAKMIESGAWVPKRLPSLRPDELSTIRIAGTREVSSASEINRTLSREADYKMDAALSELPPLRMPDVAGMNAVGNFKRDNLRKFRPAWHILVAFSIVRDDIAGAFTQPGMTSPKLWWHDLMGGADWASKTLELAAFFEEALPYLKGLKQAAPHEVVRLRIR